MDTMPISTFIWDMKYRLKLFDGNPLDKNIEGTWQRTATSLASREKDRKYWQDTFYDALTDFQLIPAGRISIGINSCGEQPLPAYGSCSLASLNLVKLIDNPFTTNAKLNTARLQHLTSTLYICNSIADGQR